MKMSHIFKINEPAFDRDAKETVLITNGIEIETVNGPVFKPTEAIAMRCFGYEKNGRAVTGWTYRKVSAGSLCPVTPNKFGFNFPKRATRYFVGRV